MSIINNKQQGGIVKNKPKILVIGPGSNQIGGVSTFINILLSSSVLKSDFDMIHLDTTRDQIDIGLENRFSISNLLYFFRQMIKFLIISTREKPILMHLPITSGISFWKSAFFILIGKLFNMKIVAHLHGGMFDNYFLRRRLSEKKLITWVLSQTDVVIALSESWRQFLHKNVRQELRVEVISNSVDPMFTSVASAPLLAKEQKGDCEILFLGSLGYRKGVFDILKAIPLVCERFPSALFLFAGDEEKRGEKKQIDHICEKQDLNKHIAFLGKVTGEDKIKLFQRATVYILPSYGENLPYSLLEAMAVGLPVVTSSVGAIPEIIQNGENGFLIQPGDYAALAERIIMILEDPKLQMSMAIKNRDKIRRSFLPDAIMNQFDEMYKRLVSVD